MKMPKQKPGSSRQDFRTPFEFIRAVETRYGKLTIDLAATGDDTRCETYIDRRTNSLSDDVDWLKEIGRGGHAWLNPPFGKIEPWAKKCYQTIIKARGKNDWPMAINMLVPASVGSVWFAQWIYHIAKVYFVRPRLSFDGKHPYPKDVMLCRFMTEPPNENTALWKWKK